MPTFWRRWPGPRVTTMAQVIDKWPALKRLLSLRPRRVRNAPFEQNSLSGGEVDLNCMPIQTCWPQDAGPLITWAMVVTRGPGQRRQNVGIYRLQKIASNRLIMRWLGHRGGALDFQAWQQKYPGKPFPVAVAIGADPASMLAAVMPIPDNLGEFQFAGLLRQSASKGAFLTRRGRRESRRFSAGHLSLSCCRFSGALGSLSSANSLPRSPRSVAEESPRPRAIRSWVPKRLVSSR